MEKTETTKNQKKTKNKKKRAWTKTRHKVITTLLRGTFGLYCRWKYGIKIEKFKGDYSRPYLIIMNHQTAFDQFFVSIAWKKPVYYLASEDLFSNGWISRLLQWVVAPIPIKKQAMDVQAIFNCLKVAKEGGDIALAPEGNRTYSGKTGYFKPSIVKLLKKLKMPLAIFRIEEGYGVQPRWSDVVRKGKMRGYVARVIEPEEYKDMSDEELFQAIYDGMYVDEACIGGPFRHKKQAEYLERAMYVCPDCGLTNWESYDDIAECQTCGRKIQYLPTRELKGVGKEFPFRFMADWYQYQCDYVNKLDYTQYLETPMFVDTGDLYQVILYSHKELLAEKVTLELYGDRIVIRNGEEEQVFGFAESEAVTVLGRNKMNIYHGDKVYQIKSDKRFNALKYVNMYHHYKNVTEGSEDGEFLGL